MTPSAIAATAPAMKPTPKVSMLAMMSVCSVPSIHMVWIFSKTAERGAKKRRFWIT